MSVFIFSSRMISQSWILKKKLFSPSEEVSFVFFELEWEFQFKEWQFVMLEAEFLGKKVKKAYSIATTNQHFQETRQLWFIVKKASENGMSHFLTKLVTIGDNVTITWPVGHFTDKNLSKNYLFVSTGSGISPIYSHLSHLIASGHTGKIAHLYWERFSEHLLKETEKIFSLNTDTIKNFLHLSQEKNLPTGRKPGHIQESLDEALNRLGDDFVAYICGKPEMVDNIRHKLTTIGIPKDNIFFEKY